VSDELVATLCLLAWSVISFFLSLFVFRWIYERESKKLLEMFNIEQIKEEFEAIVQEKMQGAIDIIGEAFEGILSQPIVKGAMTNLGKMGGDARAENMIVDQMAVDLLDSPQFAAARMGAEALGLDIEGYIEKHGAIKTITAAQQLGKLAGIDIMKIDLNNLAGSLALPRGSTNSNNPYFRR